MPPKTSLAQSMYIISSWILLFITSVNSQDIQYNLSASAVFVDSAPFNLTLNVYPTKGYLSIDLTGPSNNWFGVGFGNIFILYFFFVSSICKINLGKKLLCLLLMLERQQYDVKYICYRL